MPTDRQKFQKLQREIVEIMNGLLDLEGDEYFHKLIDTQLKLFDKHYGKKFTDDEILLLAKDVEKRRTKS